MEIGYDTTNNIGYIAASIAGTSWSNLVLEPGAGKVGIGTGVAAPGSELTVYGGASIGSSYYATAAPTNGLIVQGAVGIGTPTPGYLLNVNGTAGGPSAYVNYSDIRLKKNIAPIANALSIIQQLKGVRFQLANSGRTQRWEISQLSRGGSPSWLYCSGHEGCSTGSRHHCQRIRGNNGRCRI